MKNRVITLLTVTVGIFFSGHSFSQIQNQKTESVRIYGNCNMCKKRIEKAANLKNKVHAIWDPETQMAMVTYDSIQSKMDDILKRIALAGYDSDLFRASEEAYKKLHTCCQYQRPPAVKRE